MPAEDVTIIVAKWTLDELTPDANGDYIINNEDDWDTFATQVRNGNAFSGKTMKLNADINVSLMVGGTDNEHSFQGIFDGQGHTPTQRGIYINKGKKIFIN